MVHGVSLPTLLQHSQESHNAGLKLPGLPGTFAGLRVGYAKCASGGAGRLAPRYRAVESLYAGIPEIARSTASHTVTA